MNHKANITILALILFVVALGGYFTPVLFFAAVYIGIVFSVYFVYSLMLAPLEINSYDFLKIALSFGFFFGPGLVIIKSTPLLRTLGPLLVGPFAYTGYSPGLSFAYATLVASFLLLHTTAIPYVTNATKAHLTSLQNYRETVTTDYVFIAAMTLLIAYGFHTGQLGFDGIQPLAVNLKVGGYVRTSGLSQVAGHALPALIPTATALFIIEKNLKKRLFLASIIVVNFGFLMTTGRRQIIFSVLVSIVMYFIIDKRAVSSLSIRNFKQYLRLIIILALAGMLVLAASLGFYALRVAGWQLGETRGGKISLMQRLEVGIKVIQNPKQTNFLQTVQNESSVRPATLLVYISALQNSRQQDYMGGQCLLTNLITDIPTALWPAKNYYANTVFGCQDQQVNYNFGLVQLDSPGTVQEFGYADFGYFGFFIYPLLWASAIGFILNLFMRKRLLVFKFFTLAMTAFYSTFAEAAMVSYIDCFRAILIIYLIIVAYEFFIVAVDRRFIRHSLPSIPIVPQIREG